MRFGSVNVHGLHATKPELVRNLNGNHASDWAAAAAGRRVQPFDSPRLYGYFKTLKLLAVGSARRDGDIRNP
jgi:hypothetical protein